MRGAVDVGSDALGIAKKLSAGISRPSNIRQDGRGIREEFAQSNLFRFLSQLASIPYNRYSSPELVWHGAWGQAMSNQRVIPSHLFLRKVIMPERSKYQQKVIKNYYDNRENIALQRVQELVTELYLTEGKKRERHWKSLETHLLKLGVKPETIEHLVSQDDPQLVATLVQRLEKSAG